jgi:hypothetical protein
MNHHPTRPLHTHVLRAVAALAVVLAFPMAARADTPVTELVDGTGVLLDQSSSSSGSGSTSSTTSRTNTFTPGTYVDYKRLGNEPTVTVDRYPFASGRQYRDLTYVSAPQGVGEWSLFFKSDDLAATFRLPQHVPIAGRNLVEGQGGGDSHQAVGQRTHKVFYVDLPADCVTLNTSTDLGESFTPDSAACGTNPGFDDREWVEADETAPLPAGNTGNVYISFINFATTPNAPSLDLVRSTKDGAIGSFATDSTCNPATSVMGTQAEDPATPTACPDPHDPQLQIGGPVVADKYKTHNLYIPYLRGTTLLPLLTAGPPWELWVARSTDGGTSWTRHQVALFGDHNPANIFPELTIDKAGTLYVTWSQTQGPGSNENGLTGEQDVYYAYSTSAGMTWSPPINLTPSTGKTAVFPWMVAGDAGQVDLVYYQASTGINSNVAVTDSNGNPTNPSVWNVIFGHSNNTTNTGSNFSNTQITDHPNHVGQICTGGVGCLVGGDRSLGDFFTVDVDHLGAAVVSWTDNNGSLGIGRARVSRQVAGNGVFSGTVIVLQSSWPIRDHSARDPSGDVFDSFGLPQGSCPGMDLLGSSASRSGDILTVTLTLNSPPSAGAAMGCSQLATGGLWGAEFWTSSSLGNDNFYIAYRDNTLDAPARAEAGRVNATNATATGFEFSLLQQATLGGTCLTAAGVPNPAAPTPCTIALTTNASTLGIKSGAGLYSLTGVSQYFFGTDQPEGFPIQGGNSEQADAVAALDVKGTGTTG